MILHFLGTGSAFALSNWQTNIIIEQNGQRLLIDAGGDIRHSLHEAGLSYKNINAFYISHLHGDHIHGTEYLGFCSFFDPSQVERGKITLFGNGDLLRKAWDKAMSGGMESVEGRMPELADYFNVAPVRPNDGFTWEGIKFQLVQTLHVMNGYVIVPSFGLIADDGQKKVFLTTDTQYAPSQIMSFYMKADLIVQDCETLYKSGVHAHYEELKGLPAEIKTKMLLVHYQDNVLDSQGVIKEEWAQKAKTDGFRGFVQKGARVEV